MDVAAAADKYWKSDLNEIKFEIPADVFYLPTWNWGKFRSDATEAIDDYLPGN